MLATSYLSEIFTPYFGDGSKWGISIKYAVEKEPLGTGGAIRNAAQLLSSDESIVILNGDVLSSHNLAEQIRQHEEHNAAGTEIQLFEVNRFNKLKPDHIINNGAVKKRIVIRKRCSVDRS